MKTFLRKIIPADLRLKRLLGDGSNISTFTSSRERLMLYAEAWSSCKQGRFLEVGSHLGASAVVLAQVLRKHSCKKKDKVYCIDTWMNDAMTKGKRDTWEEFSANTAPFGEFIHPIRGDSATVTLPYSGEDYDLIFIDGDHSYEAVRQDIHRFAQLVHPEGRLLFHDSCREEVSRAIGELLANGGWRLANMVESLLSLQRL